VAARAQQVIARSTSLLNPYGCQQFVSFKMTLRICHFDYIADFTILIF
jgi:hypothetical protein